MKFFLSCCFLSITALLSAQRPELIARQDGHNSEVYHVRFSPNGKKALSAGRENRIILWDLAAGKFVRAISTESPTVLLSYSADGQQAIALLEDGTLNSWSLATGERRWQLSIATTPLIAAQVSANRHYLAVAFAGTPVSCWDLIAGRQVWSDKTLKVAPAYLHFAAADEVLVARDSTGKVSSAWQTTSGRKTTVNLKLTTSYPNLQAIGLGKGIVIQDNQARLLDYQADWEVNLSELGRVLSGLKTPVADFAFSTEGTRVGIALGVPTMSWMTTPGLPENREGKGGLLFWDVQKDQLLSPAIDLPEIVNNVALSADANRCLSASSDQTVRLWDMGTGRELQQMKPVPLMEHAFSITPDFRTLGMNNYDGYFKSWDLQQWSDLQVRPPAFDTSGYYTERDFDCFTLSNNGEQLLTGSRNSSLHLWNTSPLTHLGKLTDRHYAHWVTTALAISPDGKKALVGSADEWRVLSYNLFQLDPKTIRKYLTNDKKDTIGVQTLEGILIDGRFRLRGGLLAFTPNFNNVSLWDLETRESIRVFHAGAGNRGRTTKLRFSPDGRLAIGNGEAWNIDSQRPLTNTDGIDHFDAVYADTQPVLAATISPERRQVSLWTLPDGAIRGRLT
ncbi:MAG: PQQ-binding-like beta-propeller repeat protein, partial [Lewinellaceae bacterium]|nr:PQQ-binding-like beta-propeller repeat protein [Lewinellaceae bacterium]